MLVSAITSRRQCCSNLATCIDGNNSISPTLEAVEPFDFSWLRSASLTEVFPFLTFEERAGTIVAFCARRVKGRYVR